MPFTKTVRIASGTGFTIDATCLITVGFTPSYGYEIFVPAGAAEPLIASLVLTNPTVVNYLQFSANVGSGSGGSFLGQLNLMVANSTGGVRVILEPSGYTQQGDCVYALTS